MIGQSHEDAVEPHLVGIDGLVPVYALFGAGLFLHLLHEGLHGLEVLLFGEVLIHAGHEVSGTDLVEVVVFQAVAANLALGVDHRVGIHLAIPPDVVVTIFQVGVEHGFQFDTHHVAPLGSLGEVEHVRLGHAFHLRVGHPFAVVLVGHLLQHQSSVHIVVVEHHVAGLSRLEVALCHAVEAAVVHVDVIHIRAGVESDNLYAVLALLAGDIVEMHVAHGGQVATAADFVVLIVEVDFQHRLATLSHLDVAGIDILDDTAAAGVGLDAHHAVETGAVHLVVLGKHVAASARDFTADDHTSVSVLHLAVAYDDVLAGFVPESSVHVASALDGDAVVAGVEVAVLNEHTVTRFGVTSVAVGAVVVDVYASHGHVLAEQGVDDPEGRTQQGHALDEHTVTLVGVDELRAQSVGLGEASVVHVHAVFGHLQQSCTAAVSLAGHALFPSVVGSAAPGPPGLAVAAAVDGTLAGDGDVGLLIGIDTG